MYKTTIKNLESKLNYKIKQNFCSIGWDVAEKCGVSIITTTKTNVSIDWCLLEFDRSEIKEVYKQLCQESFKILKGKTDVCIIEDTYLKYFGKFAQADVFKKLTRFGGLVLANAINQEIKFEIIGATSARSKFKIKTTGYGKGNSKQGVMEWIKNCLEIDLPEDNCCDAIVLALLGICEDMDFKPKTKKKAVKRK